MSAWDVDAFIAKSGASESTLSLYRRHLATLERMSGRPLAKLTLRELAELKAKLRQRRSGDHMIKLLRMFYRQGGLTELADASRFKVKKPKLRPDEILTPDEVNRILNACLTLRDRALFGALYETGGRISELLDLKWEDVSKVEADSNGGKRAYRLWFNRVKVAGEEHEGYILDTVEPFEAWLKADPFKEKGKPLFPTFRGDRFSKNNAWARLQTAVRRAEVNKRVYPHLFRHTRATHLLAAGVPEASVKKLLGWAPDSRQLARYSHLSNRDAYRSLLKVSGVTLPDERIVRFEWKEIEVPAIPVKPVYGLALPRGAHKSKAELAAEILADVAGLRQDFARLSSMNRELMETLAKHGIEVPGSGAKA